MNAHRREVLLARMARPAHTSRQRHKRQRARRALIRADAVRDRYADERAASEWIDHGGEGG